MYLIILLSFVLIFGPRGQLNTVPPCHSEVIGFNSKMYSTPYTHSFSNANVLVGNQYPTSRIRSRT